MDLTTQLEVAIGIASSAHMGQRGRADAPYVLHPLRVMMKATSLEDKIVAVLHDVIEDSSMTKENLIEAGIDPVLAERVQKLTRMQLQAYDSYISTLEDDKDTLRVKLLDLEDNMNMTLYREVKGEAFPSILNKLGKRFRAYVKLRNIVNGQCTILEEGNVMKKEFDNLQ